LGAYEDLPNVQLKSETFQAAREILAGEWASISKSWEIRRAAMLDILTKAQAFSFKPVVQFDPVGTVQLSQALTRGVYEKDKAEKKTYHVVNAFSLLLRAVGNMESEAKGYKVATTAALMDDRLVASCSPLGFSLFSRPLWRYSLHRDLPHPLTTVYRLGGKHAGCQTRASLSLCSA